MLVPFSSAYEADRSEAFLIKKLNVKEIDHHKIVKKPISMTSIFFMRKMKSKHAGREPFQPSKAYEIKIDVFAACYGAQTR